MNLISYCPHLPLCICFLVLFVATAFSAADAELKALLEFKKGIQTDPLSIVNGTWLMSSVDGPNSCPQSWTGVSCDENGNITALVLDRRGLAGELKFQTLLDLKMLKTLSLSGNDFTGRLVPALGTISSLEHLDLSGNKFYGPIPERINDLWGLNYLNFSLNSFTGGFPVGRLNLNQLKVLDFHWNGLSGDIGNLLSQLRNVEYVDLSGNEFYGGLAIGSSNLSSLANKVKFLNFSSNKLNGGFFDGDSISLLRNLDVLDLSHNQIVGELPSFGALPNLQVLRLGNNHLSGSIPEELLNSSMRLRELDLSENAFTGSLFGINSTTLNVLNLSSNALSGLLPPFLKSCVVIDLSRNVISGDLSVLEAWEANLEVLDLSSNEISGSFPNFTSHFERLKVLHLNNNNLVGALPFSLGNYPSLSAVDLSLNGFSGTIPASFFASVNLMSLNLSGNYLTGPIPLQSSAVSELLVKPSDLLLEYLDLSNNSLTGGLPTEICYLIRLKLLNLAKNELSGSLPEQLTQLSSLEYLDLSRNKFTGKIPYKLSPSLRVFNVSYNDLSGLVPENLRNFPVSSFHPGNDFLILPHDFPSTNSVTDHMPGGRNRHSRGHIRVVIIVASIGATLMIVFVLLAYRRAILKELRRKRKNAFIGQDSDRAAKLGRFSRPPFLKFNTNTQLPRTSSSFSNNDLLISGSRSLSVPAEYSPEISEQVLPTKAATNSEAIDPNLIDFLPASSSSSRIVEAPEQPVMLEVYSPDRLAGELFFLDNSPTFSAEELSRAPAEVLGRSSHGTLYKATLDSGHMLAVKWLRVGLVKQKKEFSKEVKKIGAIRHPNIVPVRAYYWGPKEQERLLLGDYVEGDSLSLHLYETTPRRHSPLSFIQRLKISVEVARCLLYLHDRGLPHGNLKPTNVLLVGPHFNPCLTDFSLHRLMTPSGVAEQILNLGALGYRAPELTTSAKPIPTVKADVYAFGVILMELITRRSAGDIISGQSGAVDLPDWVRLCDQEGRRMDCVDREIASGEENLEAMDELVAVSLRCILPVNERPNMRQVFEDLSGIST